MGWSTWQPTSTSTETWQLGTACKPQRSLSNLTKIPVSELFCFVRIDRHFLIKITDFGLSEDVFERNYFRQESGGDMVRLPVKWMAPESLSDGHFSEKSDVVRVSHTAHIGVLPTLCQSLVCL